MKEKYEVSVICVTYNQENYLSRALDSMLSQKTSFDYEIIVRNDASTDGTKELLESYRKKHSDILKVINNEENLFSQGVDFFADTIYRHARGKYIAICEGDDYWVDDTKLQRQYEALENHSECDMCACRALMMSADEKHVLGEIRPKDKDGILNADEVILGGGMYLATNSLFFRKSMYDSMMEFEKVRSLDYVYQMKGALRGGIYYIDKPMAAYRRYSVGSQTINLTGDNSVMNKQCQQEMEILRTLDKDTDGRFHDVIKQRLNDYGVSYYDQLVNNRSEIKKLDIQHKQNIVIWGMGLRGKALEKFCWDEKIKLSGICDITDRNVGNVTEYGNKVVEVAEAMKSSDLILASVEGAYRYLIEKDVSGTVINMFQYMSRS